MGEELESAEVCKKVLSGAQLSKELDRLLEDKASNQRIIDWVEVRLYCLYSSPRVNYSIPIYITN